VRRKRKEGEREGKRERPHTYIVFNRGTVHPEDASSGHHPVAANSRNENLRRFRRNRSSTVTFSQFWARQVWALIYDPCDPSPP